MAEYEKKVEAKIPPDRIAGDEIILDGQGKFPKKLIIIDGGRKLEYRIVKTRNGGYLLN